MSCFGSDLAGVATSIASLLARRFGRSASTLCGSLEHYRRTDPALFGEPPDLP